MTTLENTTIYHEIDFLLPAQRFNINFSYITGKGLPFVREFVLRTCSPCANLNVAGRNFLLDSHARKFKRQLMTLWRGAS